MSRYGQSSYPTRNFATLGSYPSCRHEDWTISSSRGWDVRRMASEDSRKHFFERSRPSLSLAVRIHRISLLDDPSKTGRFEMLLAAHHLDDLSKTLERHPFAAERHDVPLEERDDLLAKSFAWTRSRRPRPLDFRTWVRSDHERRPDAQARAHLVRSDVDTGRSLDQRKSQNGKLDVA